MSASTDIASNLASVRRSIEQAAERAGRDTSGVNLVAVTKTFPVEAVLAAWEAGQTEFAENRVQEAAGKVRALAATGAHPRWHLIGHLQTNKARDALSLFAIIHSVDSLHLAETLSRRAAPGYPVLIEINVAGEASKTGIATEAAEAAIETIRALPNLNVRGLMTVAPHVADAEDVRPVFRGLASMARRFQLPEVSMGMSSDFVVAIEEGATIVRIGTAIFGQR